MRWGWVAAFALGCSGRAPVDALNFVERWELLGVMGDGSVVDARITVGNTGLLRGQGRVEVDHWPRAGEAVRYVRHSAPAATTRSGDGRTLVLDTDHLEGSGDIAESWHLRARSDDANAVLHVQGRGQAIPAVSGSVPKGSWTVGAPVGIGTMKGWIEAGERGGKVDGWGMVLRRGGDGRPGADRRGVFVLSDDLALGVDTQGPITIAWGRLDGRALDMSAARIVVQDGTVRLDLRPAEELAVDLVPTSAHGRTDRTAHWTPPERWAMSALGGRADRQVAGASVQVVAGDLVDQQRRGLVVWTDDTPLDLPTAVTDRPSRRRRQR